MKIQYKTKRISFHEWKENRLLRMDCLNSEILQSLSTMIKQLSNSVIWRSLVNFKKAILLGMGVKVTEQWLAQNRKGIKERAITGDFF